MDAQEWTQVLQVVAAAAGQGARSVTRGRQIVADATVNTVQRWESIVLRGRAIADLESWARHVGANEAKRLLARSRACSRWTVDGHAPDASVDIEVVAPGEDCASDGGCIRLPQRVERRELARWKKILRGRQFEVVARMLQPGMTLGRAAQELRMDRANVRRSLRSALARMNRCESDSPPLPSAGTPSSLQGTATLGLEKALSDAHEHDFVLAGGGGWLRRIDNLGRRRMGPRWRGSGDSASCPGR
jgi:DNA-directed RNA polymerase specialized sigma24 family protein